MVLHIVETIATPHNNSLIAALRNVDGLKVVTWYARRTQRGQWKSALGDANGGYYYDTPWNGLRFVKRVVFGKNDVFLLCGYSDVGTRFVIAMAWLLGRQFAYWTDYPRTMKRSPSRALLNRIALHLVRRMASPVFVVGKHAVQRFKELDFLESELVNLPIFIELPPMRAKSERSIVELRRHFGIGADAVLYVGGSRLIRDKGFDVLVYAVAEISESARRRMKVVIVGTGTERESLEARARAFGLSSCMAFENWMEPKQWETLVAAADVFVHPARFDAFGGGTLVAMANGVPVIGSACAGAVLERLVHGYNGLIFQGEDASELAKHMVRLLDESDERIRLGRNARSTAEQWPPSRGA